MRDSDIRQRFVFEHTQVRGELVSLDATLRAVLERHPYPPVVAQQLGQALAAAALLGATIKFDGHLTLQLQGDGPVHLLLAQCTSQGSLRGLARWHGDLPADIAQAWPGSARLMITIEQGRRERYQGIVAVTGGDLAGALETYFAQSEQLPTRIWLSAHSTRAAGLLLQRLPGTDVDADAWERTVHLATTLSNEEMLGLSGTTVLHRLFHEEEVRLFEQEPVSFRCTCSRERVSETLVALGRAELEAILAEEGNITVACEFCNHHYRFDAVDVEQLLAGSVTPAPKTAQ